MSRRYQHTIELLPQIREMLNQGMTQKEVENALGLVGDRPIHNLLKRERRKNYKEYKNNEEENRQKHCKNTNMKTSV